MNDTLCENVQHDKRNNQPIQATSHRTPTHADHSGVNENAHNSTNNECPTVESEIALDTSINQIASNEESDSSKANLRVEHTIGINAQYKTDANSSIMMSLQTPNQPMLQNNPEKPKNK